MTDWTYVVIALIAAIALVVCFWLQGCRIKEMVESDKVFKKANEDAGKKSSQEGRSRSRWDYSSIPCLQRMCMKVDPRLLLATFLLLIITALWLFTKEGTLLDLMKVNVGALLGTLVARNDKDDVDS
ncbi:MAG: hypothetical protein WCN95_04195 [bacterium]